MQRKFTLDDARCYRPMNSKILLVSDIRPSAGGDPRDDDDGDAPTAASAADVDTAAPAADPATVEKTNSSSRKSGKKSNLKVAGGGSFADMLEQRAWVETIVPKQALLRLVIPYDHEGGVVEYLGGEMHVQPFAKRSSTEVRLLVSPPTSVNEEDGEATYPVVTYDCATHEECMFHHNCVTRREHIREKDAPRTDKRPISYDHRLAHGIIQSWVDKTRADPEHMTGGIISREHPGIVERHVTGIIRGLDKLYGKMLGLRWSEQFAGSVALSSSARGQGEGSGGEA